MTVNIPKIKLMISNKAKYDIQIRKLIKKCCEAVLTVEKYAQNVEISVTLTDNEEIRVLNKNFRNKDNATDVLSFPMNEINPDTGFTVLGDIVISVEKAAEQAESYGHGIEREMAFLTVHSMLHLLGYEHEENPEGEKEMRLKQKLILDKLKYTVGKSETT